MKLLPALLPALALLFAGTAAGAAPPPRLDLPGGTLGEAVAVLGQQAGVSISVADAGLWQRRVAPVRGRMSVGEALRRMIGSRDIEIAALDSRTWRIALQPRRPPHPHAPPPPPAAAPEAAPIIVTASKRDVRLGAYQGGASVLDGDDLAFGGERGTDAVLSRLATVSSTHLGAGRNKLFIRGIADSSFTGPTQATVGQYLGDIRLNYNAPDPDLRLYDIASVEVLEGPQATLYGAGSLGGIIRIVRNPPKTGVIEAAASMGVSATWHGAPGGDIGGMVNLPLAGERLALRLVGYAVSDGGYIDDPLRRLNNINRTATLGGRAMLRFDAGDDWTIDLGGTLQHIDGDDSQYADRAAPPLTHTSRFAQGFAARYALADLIIAKRWDSLRFLSSSGIAGQQLFERFDASVPGGPDRLFAQANHTQLLSNETRLWRPMQDGFGWVVGGSLLHNSTRLTRALGPVAAPLPVTGVTNSIGEATLFGEASFMPLPWLTLTGGGRLTHAWLSGGGEDVAPPAPALAPMLEFARAQVTADRTETRLLPSLAISVVPAPGVIVFTRLQQGFRPGGLTVDGDFVRRFRSDRVATAEAGIRYGETERDRFDLSATFAATRWRDIQADFVDASGLPTTANIGDGRIFSVAVRAGWRPLAGLRLDAGMTFNDSRVTAPSPELVAALVKFAADTATDFATNFATARVSQIPNVARYAARTGVDYTAPVGDALSLHVAAAVQYIGRSRLGIGPVLGAEQGDYIDSNLTVRLGRPGFGVTLGLTNLADTVGNRFALGTPFVQNDDGQVTPLRPRTLRLGVDARF